MTIQDFLHTYEFHDSLLEYVKVESKTKSVSLTVDFCYWMQKDFSENEDETGIISVTFSDVSFFDGPVGEINDFTILSTKLISGNQLVFSLMDDDENLYTELSIKAESVSVTKK